MKINIIGGYDSKQQKFPYETFDFVHNNETFKWLTKAVNENKDLYLFTVHSDLFNMIGHLIANGKLIPDQVKIMLIDKDGFTTEDIFYNNEGFLENWLIGFFDWDLFLVS
jgi:predicted ATPase